MKVRINKFLANAGVGSRRKVEGFLKNNEIKINEQIALPGQQIDTQKDKIFYKNKEIFLPKSKIYIAFNKPINVLSSTIDDRNRKTIMHFLDIKERIYPIGRLDYNSRGLILLTNDGDLSLKLTHPRFHLPKKYIVRTKQKINKLFLEKMTKANMIIEGKKLIPTITGQIDDFTFEITLFQGIKRQIRQMCKTLGYDVEDLQRIQIGHIVLNGLKEGFYYHLTKQDIEKFKDINTVSD